MKKLEKVLNFLSGTKIGQIILFITDITIGFGSWLIPLGLCLYLYEKQLWYWIITIPFILIGFVIFDFIHYHSCMAGQATLFFENKIFCNMCHKWYFGRFVNCEVTIKEYGHIPYVLTDKGHFEYKDKRKICWLCYKKRKNNNDKKI